MKIYLAAIYTSGFGRGQVTARLTPKELEHRFAIKHYLESYHYVKSAAMVQRIREDGVKVFLDSGAFSAFSQGAVIDLPQYCEYIKENADIIDVASVLDAIGDAEGTYNNQRTMEQLGTRPLPCFHYGEDPRYLKYYLEHYPYITLGGMVPVPNKTLIHWLDRIWDKYLTDSAGHPIVKVHGFGLTSYKLMQRYPWFSVDSSSWVQAARTGAIYIPPLKAVSVSTSSPSAKQENAHIDTMPPVMRQYILDLIERAGYDITRLQTEYISRFAFNCHIFTLLNEQLNITGKTFVPEQEGLF